MEHPAYDAFWQGQALDKLVAAAPSPVPTMWIQGLWDQEDMWGAIHCYLALKAQGQADHNYLVMGPWRHSQVNYDGYNLGPVEVGWRHRPAIPPRCAEAVLRSVPENRRAQGRHAAGLHLQHRRESLGSSEELAAGLRAGLRRAAEAAVSPGGLWLGIREPVDRGPAADSYVSDPAKPVPYVPRPVRFTDSDRWKTWLVTDQRSVADRTDVLTYQTPVLTAPVRISGAPVADLFAATSGTDCRLGGEADRCLPGRGSEPAGDGRLSTGGVDGHFPRPLSRELRAPLGHPGRQTAALSLRAADRQSRVSAGPPDHGADPVELVPALRPQSRRPTWRTSSSPKPADYVKATQSVFRSGEQASAVWLPVVQ